MKRWRESVGTHGATAPCVTLGGLFATLDPAMLACDVLPRLDAASLGRLACTCRGLRALVEPRLRARQQRLVQLMLVALQKKVVLQTVLELNGRMWYRYADRLPAIPLGYRIVMRESHCDSHASTAQVPRDRVWKPVAWTRNTSLPLPWPGDPRPWCPLMWTCTRARFDRFRESRDPAEIDVLEEYPAAGLVDSSAVDVVLTPLLHAVPVDGVRPHVAYVCTVRPCAQRAVAELGSLQQLTYVVQEYDLGSGETREGGLESADVARYVRHTLADSFDDAPPDAFLRLPPAVAYQHQTTHALRCGVAAR